MKKLLFLCICFLLTGFNMNAKMRIFTHVDTASFLPELRQELIIHFTSSEMTDSPLQIYDMKGRTEVSIPIKINQGFNEINISVSGLNPGPHLLRLQHCTRVFIKDKS